MDRERSSTQPPRPPNANDLTDDELGALLAQGWSAADDGTLTPPPSRGASGAAGSPGSIGPAYPGGGDAGPGQEPLPAPPAATHLYDGRPNAGGFGAAPALPATSPPAGPPPSLAGAAPDTLLGAPLPKPGVPKLSKSLDFAGDANPMQEATAAPFEAPNVTPPLMSQPGPDLKAAAAQRMSTPKGGGGYAGKVGRRMTSKTTPTSRRRR